MVFAVGPTTFTTLPVAIWRSQMAFSARSVRT